MVTTIMNLDILVYNVMYVYIQVIKGKKKKKKRSIERIGESRPALVSTAVNRQPQAADESKE